MPFELMARPGFDLPAHALRRKTSFRPPGIFQPAVRDIGDVGRPGIVIGQRRRSAEDGIDDFERPGAGLAAGRQLDRVDVGEGDAKCVPFCGSRRGDGIVDVGRDGLDTAGPLRRGLSGFCWRCRNRRGTLVN